MLSALGWGLLTFTLASLILVVAVNAMSIRKTETTADFIVFITIHISNYFL